MRRNESIFCKWCVLLLLVCMLSGCGKENSEQTAAEETSAVAEEQNTLEKAEKETASEAENQTASENETGEFSEAVQVDTVEDFLEAIQPGATILFAPGYYNFSQYIEEVWAEEGETWNKNHPYVNLKECFDGVEIVIQHVDGLFISGDNENLTEIVIDPRYAQVLNFEECNNISLSGLTMGHTEIGDCSGNVLNFYGCQNINLSAMDLYGCGVYGIGSYDGTGEMYVYSSTIRDCAYGALEILDGDGRFEFRNCSLTGSEAYDRYEKSPHSELAFYECMFGDNETSYYMFLEDIYTEDCIWSENCTYPEYGYDEWVVFEPETMEDVAIDKKSLDDTFWEGYALVNPESGETVMIPYEEADGTYNGVSLELYADGTGWYENTGEYSNITWECDEDRVYITLEDGRNYYITAYTMGGESTIWLLMEIEECLVWLY